MERRAADRGYLLARCKRRAILLQPLIPPDRHTLHLRRDHSLAGVVHLRDVGSCAGTTRIPDMLEAKLARRRIGGALLAEVGGGTVEQLGIATLDDPWRADIGKASAQVDRDIGVGI